MLNQLPFPLGVELNSVVMLTDATSALQQSTDASTHQIRQTGGRPMLKWHP